MFHAMWLGEVTIRHRQAKLWHGARTRRAMYSRKAERNRMTGFQTSLRMFGIGRTYQGKQSHGTRLRAWGSARHAPLQNGQPSRSSSNSALIPRKTFIESTSNITFKQQAEIWLKSLANRKRNPLEQTTIDNRRYALDKWMCPFSVTSFLRIYTTLP